MCLFVLTQFTNVTDRQTHRHAAYYAGIARQKLSDVPPAYFSQSLSKHAWMSSVVYYADDKLLNNYKQIPPQSPPAILSSCISLRTETKRTREPTRTGHLTDTNFVNHLIATLKPQSNGPSYSNTEIGTLAVDGHISLTTHLLFHRAVVYCV